MAGTTWPNLLAGRKAKASEVENKFDWIEGSIVPMSMGNKTNAAYDLGEASYRWKTLYLSDKINYSLTKNYWPGFKALDTSTAILFSNNAEKAQTTSGATEWVKLKEITLNAPLNKIQINYQMQRDPVNLTANKSGIWRNGVWVGSTNTAGGVGWFWFKEVISGWSQGDTIELWGAAQDTGDTNSVCYVKNLRLLGEQVDMASNTVI